jgi:hypothetical protein
MCIQFFKKAWNTPVVQLELISLFFIVVGVILSAIALFVHFDWTNYFSFILALGFLITTIGFSLLTGLIFSTSSSNHNEIGEIKAISIQIKREIDHLEGRKNSLDEVAGRGSKRKIFVLFVCGLIIIAISLIVTGVVWAEGNEVAFVLLSGFVFFGVQMAYDGIKPLLFPD